MYSALSLYLNTTTEVPLSKAPYPQLLPGRRSINDFGCVFSLLCVAGLKKYKVLNVSEFHQNLFILCFSFIVF